MYIGTNVRQRLDKEIEALAQAVSKSVSTASVEYSLAGIAGYAVSKLFARVVALRGGVSDANIASVFGTLESAKQEFSRKVAGPFFERQRNMNGEVFAELI